MENVAIIIDDESPPGRLFGLYEGSLDAARYLRRGASRSDHALPGHDLSIRPHTRRPSPPRRVALLHEVGHHFGLAEARLRELGWA